MPLGCHQCWVHPRQEGPLPRPSGALTITEHASGLPQHQGVHQASFQLLFPERTCKAICRQCGQGSATAPGCRSICVLVSQGREEKAPGQAPGCHSLNTTKSSKTKESEQSIYLIWACNLVQRLVSQCRKREFIILYWKFCCIMFARNMIPHLHSCTKPRKC